MTWALLTRGEPGMREPLSSGPIVQLAVVSAKVLPCSNSQETVSSFHVKAINAQLPIPIVRTRFATHASEGEQTDVLCTIFTTGLAAVVIYSLFAYRSRTNQGRNGRLSHASLQPIGCTAC